MSKILLVGDLCRDVFLTVNCDRVSPERPCLVVSPHTVDSNLGMAGNVAANIESLFPGVQLTTLFPPQISTKTRYVDRASNQHLLRVDQDVKCLPMDAKTFIDTLDNVKPDAVVLSDYAKGYLNQDNMKAISLLCQSRGIPTFADTKCLLGSWSEQITVVKINQKEFDAQLMAGISNPWFHCQTLIVTKGAKGMESYNREGFTHHRTKPNNVQVKDVVGAGDSALAALVVGYLETRDLQKAMNFAEKACEVAVSKKGVVAVKREEVIWP